MQKPSDGDRELLRLWSGQQHAIVQRVEKPRVADPLFLLHQLRVHDRDLSARPAEADEPELHPKPEGFVKCWVRSFH